MGRSRKSQIDWRSVRLITSAQSTRAFLSRLQLKVAIPILLGSLLAACGSSSSSTPAPAKTLTAITIDPVNSSIAVGTRLQLHATGVYSNKTTKDLTDSVTWASADTAVAHFSNAAAAKGLAGGIGVGATTVTAAFKGVKGVSAFTVTQAGLTSITVEPVNPLLAKGTALQLAAQGNFSDGTVQDLTTQVTWSSGKSSLAQVSNASATIGLVTGVSIGNTPITATLGGTQGSTAVTVTAPTLTSITITSPVDSIAKGTSVQLTATCNFSDGAAEDCTTEATWTSSNNGIARVGKVTPTTGLVTGVGVGSTSITGAFGGTQGSAKVAVTPATLTSIAITPPAASIAKGTAVRLTATGKFSDGTTEDLTAQVSWTSSNNALAQVSNLSDAVGLATGLGEGNTSITATLKGIEGSTTLTVTAATLTSITITAPVDSIAKGTAAQLFATCNFSDGTTDDCTNQVSWTSGNNAIAQVSDAPGTKGVVTALGIGNTSIIVTLNGVQGSAAVTETAATLTSITITDPTIAKGTTVQLTATGNFSDGSTEDLTSEVSWTSNSNETAQVSDAPGTRGLLTALSVGSASITATLNGVQGSAAVTVTAATLTSITITAPVDSIAKGTAAQLFATCNFSDGTTEDCTNQVSWTSGNNVTAQDSDAPGTRGLVTALSIGFTSITATLNGVQGSAAITVTAATLTSIAITPPNSSIANGTALQLTATGDFSDGSTEDLTNEVSWTSGNNTIAQISDEPGSKGLGTALSIGSTSITATLNGVQGSAAVTVTPATLSSLTITPPDPALANGTTVQLSATGNFSDGSTEDLTNQVSWTSGDGTIAQVSNALATKGLATALSVGSTSITATLNGVQGSTTLTVTAPSLTTITVDPDSPSIAKGATIQLAATCDFTDGTTENCTTEVSWTSSDNAITQVSDAPGSRGLVTGLGVGSTEITVTLNGVQDSTTVTVTPPTLTSLVVTPANPSIEAQNRLQMTAVGTFSDGTTEDLTKEVDWTSSNLSVARMVSSNVSLNGVLFSVGAGVATVTATLGSVMGSTPVTVTSPIVTSIRLTPSNLSIAKGTAVQLGATCNFSDGTTEDCSTEVSWTSASNAMAQVSNVSGSEGVVTALQVGSTSIIATFEGIQGSTNVAVTAPALTSLTITPVNPTVPNGTTLQMMATAVFSDGTTQNVTSEVDWSSSNTNVAHVISSSSPKNNGQLIAKKPGLTTITAELEGIEGSTNVTVTQ